MKELFTIAREIIKNFLMAIPGFARFRKHILSGRTTGTLEADEAVSYAEKIYDQFIRGLADASHDQNWISGKSVMEIGPGSNLAVPFQFMTHGAREVWAIDRFPDLQRTAKQDKIYSLLARKSEGFRSLPDMKNYLDAGLIRYFGNCPIEKSGNLHPGKFDLIVSHHALEHVRYPDKAIASIAMSLKAGGISIHVCNLRSLGGVYRCDVEPLRLLKYPDWLWNMMFGSRGGSNRARCSDYEKMFEQNHLKILHLEVLNRLTDRELEKIKPGFYRTFRNKESDDLSVLRFRIVVQKSTTPHPPSLHKEGGKKVAAI